MNYTTPETDGLTDRQIDEFTKHQAPGLTTRQLAEQAGVVDGSIRVRLCKTGSYFGLQPERLPNGRLLWPADSLERLKEAGRRTPTPVVGRNRTAESASAGAA